MSIKLLLPKELMRKGAGIETEILFLGTKKDCSV